MKLQTVNARMTLTNFFQTKGYTLTDIVPMTDLEKKLCIIKFGNKPFSSLRYHKQTRIPVDSTCELNSVQ